MSRAIFIVCVVLSFTLSTAQPPQKKNTNDPTAAEIQKLAAVPAVKTAFTIIDNLEPVTLKELILLTEIPAPPFAEVERANKFKQMLEDAGADKVWIDSIGNVLALRKGKMATRTVALDAHLDTVFPKGTDVKVKMKGDTLFAPGVGDDTRGLIAMLTVLKSLEKAGIETKDDVLFIGSVGEEGLGDLRGVKYIFKNNKPKIDSWISIDGEGIGTITNGALGSVRYRVTVKGPGGHSWSAFGLGNPHHALGKAIDYFAEEALKFTSSPGPKTSFNVGRIGGGTSINAIPFESWMEVDMRSENAERLTRVEEIFHSAMDKAISDYNKNVAKGPMLTLLKEKIGFRPSGLTDVASPIVMRSLAAARYFVAETSLNIESTNANIPISKGVPAITIGPGGKSGNAHSLNEWWLNDKGADGIKFSLLVLLSEAGIAK